MKKCLLLVVLTAVAAGLLPSTAARSLAAEPVKSGLQAGEKITSIFEPFNVTGPFAGDRHCLVCENGANPVALIFAREISPGLAKLLARLETAAARNKERELGAFAVFLSNRKGLNEQLKDLAKRQTLKTLVLSTDDPAGPDGFGVSEEADVTVLFYERYQVKANHAFRQGELTDAAIEKILADLPKILPDK